MILGLGTTGVEQALQLGNGNVAEQGPRFAVDNGEVRIVALESKSEGEGDGIGGGEGECGGGLEVFYCGLFCWGDVMC